MVGSVYSNIFVEKEYPLIVTAPANIMADILQYVLNSNYHLKVNCYYIYQ